MILKNASLGSNNDVQIADNRARLWRRRNDQRHRSRAVPIQAMLQHTQEQRTVFPYTSSTAAAQAARFVGERNASLCAVRPAFTGLTPTQSEVLTRHLQFGNVPGEPDEDAR